MKAPSWIDPEIWDCFVEMRKAKGKRAPFTPRAAAMIVHELDRLRGQGHNPDEVLRASVMNGWSGVFALKHLDSSRPKMANGVPHKTFAEIDSENLADHIHQMTGGLMGKSKTDSNTIDMEAINAARTLLG